MQNPDDGSTTTGHTLEQGSTVLPLGKWEGWVFVRSAANEGAKGWLRYHLLSPSPAQKESCSCPYISMIAIQGDSVITGRGVSAQIQLQPGESGKLKAVAKVALVALAEAMCYAFTSKDSNIPDASGFRPVLDEIYIFGSGVLKSCGSKLMSSDLILKDSRIPEKEVRLEHRTGVAWARTAMEQFNAFFLPK